jgi:hypothetical protein
MSLGVARIRAILGIAFAAVGLVIGAELLAKPVPFSQKTLGLAFAAVLVILGIVRVRMYVVTRRRLDGK